MQLSMTKEDKDKEELNIKNAVKMYGRDIEHACLMPGYSINPQKNDYEQIAFVFNDITGLQPNLMNKLFGGISICEILMGDGEGKRYEYFGGDTFFKSRDFLEKLNNSCKETVKDQTMKPSLEIISRNPDDGKDLRSWEPEMGRGNSFVGVFTADIRMKNDTVLKKFYLVANTQGGPGSEGLRSIIAKTKANPELGKKVIDMKDFFEKEPMVNIARTLNSRNRHALLAQVALNCGISISYASDPVGFTSKSLLGMPFVNCEYNTLKYNNDIKKVIYYSDLYDLTNFNGPIPFLENFVDGIKLYNGPNYNNFAKISTSYSKMTVDQIGGNFNIRPNNETLSYGGFPISAGRSLGLYNENIYNFHDKNVNNYASSDMPYATQSMEWCVWEGKDLNDPASQFNNHYSRHFFNSSYDWPHDYMEKMGCPSGNGFTQLRPLCVKVPAVAMYNVPFEFSHRVKQPGTAI
jgi:hypothetical protein